MNFISIQHDDFSHQECYQRLANNPKCGAIVTFTGLVRDFSNEQALKGIELEHYPKMTEQVLEKLANHAREKFSVSDIVIIHRVGKLLANEQIVFVGVSSRHRKEGFLAAQFLMDRLKNDVPLWKKEITSTGVSFWVDAKQSDKEAGEKWL